MQQDLYRTVTLSNGIRCILYPRAEIHSISIQAIVHAGSLYETKEKNGISHLIEHVVHAGTKRFDNWEKIDAFVNEYSGSTNASTKADTTMYYGKFPAQFAKEAVIYFSEIIRHPLLNTTDINRQRRIILDEMRSHKDSVHYKVLQNIKKNRFLEPNAPYSFDVVGTKQSVQGVSQNAIQDYYTKHYSPGNIELFIVGRIDISKLELLLEKYFVENEQRTLFGRETKAIKLPSKPVMSDFRINALQKADLDQTYLTFDFPGFAEREKPITERLKVQFVLSMLASSQYNQSFLWKRLREDLHLVYSVSTSAFDLEHARTNIIQTACKRESIGNVIHEVKKGIGHIKQGNAGRAVFEARKKRMINRQWMILDDPIEALGWIRSFEKEKQVHGVEFWIDDLLHFIENLTFAEVVDSANQLLDVGKMQIGVVSKERPEVVRQVVRDAWG